MNSFKMTRIVSFALAALCLGALVALAGCAAQNNPATEAQTANRQYMAQVNQTMDDLSQKLEGFEDAVSRGDVVTMRTQADDAFRTLDSLAALQPPEVLKDVQQGYVDGCNQLKGALNDYIALYTDVANGSANGGAYADRLAAVQEAYNAGVDKLKATDEAATKL